MKTVHADNKWYRGHEDKEKRKKRLSSGMVWFNQLREMYNELLQSKREKSEGEKEFDSPGWAYKEAYNLGVRRGIGIALGLLPEMKD